MRVRLILVLVAVALLLGGGALYFWQAGWPSSSWIEGGKAATNQHVAEAVTGNSAPVAATLGRALPADDKAGGSGVARVAVTPVRKSEVPIYLSGIGTVQAYYKIDITAQVDGIITKMPFQEGQDVKVGDTLVEIDPTMYQAKLDLAKAQRDRAAVQLENSKTNLWRDEELLKHDFASQKQTDQERMLVGQYRAEVAQYEAEMKFAQARLDYATIKSPINGRISIRAVDPGNLVRAGQETTLATVVQLKPISVLITVSAKELERHGVSLGITSLPVFAYAVNGITPLGRGEVRTVNVLVSQNTGTITLKANFPNEQEKLWPGDFVDCRIVVEKRNDGLTVPSAAVHQGPKGDYVWLVTPDNTAAIRPVRVRQSLGGTSLIEGPIQEGDSVVLDGYQRLQAGSRVSIIPEATDVGSRASVTE
jgi:membrane fusion protein, multidrug efflux system